MTDNYTPQSPTPKNLADHWIIRELLAASTNIDTQLENYRFAEAAETVYHAIWDNVADWFVEASKTQDNPDMLAWVLETSLKIAHPFAPFVTETIWQTLNWSKTPLILSTWPTPVDYDDIAAGEFEQLQKLVVEARYVMAELPGNEKYGLLYQNDSLIADNANLITHLARIKEVREVDQAKGLRLAASNREAWLDVSEETLYEHQTNLEVRLAEARATLKNLETRLGNETYVQKAPAHLVEESKQQLEQKRLLITRLETELQVLR